MSAAASSETAEPVAKRRFGFFRFCRRLIWKLLLWFIIASAVIVSLGRLFAPYADRARPLVEELLGQALNQPVQIGRIEAQWPRLSPQIMLHDLTVGSPDDAMLQVDRARFEVKLYNLLRPARNSFELIALGLNLALVQDADGRWSWQIEGGGQVAGGWQRGLSAGDLKLRGSTIRVAPFEAPPLIWDVPEADLNRRGDRLRIRFSAFERFDLEAASSESFAEPTDQSALRLAERYSGQVQSPLDVRVALDLRDDSITGLQAYLNNERSRLPVMLTRWLARATEQDFNPAAVPELEAATRIWLNWADPEPFKLHAELAFSGLTETAASEFRLNGFWQPGDWALELDAMSASNDSEAMIQGLAFGQREGRSGLALGRLDLEPMHALLSHWLEPYPFWPSSLSGAVEDIQAGWSADATPFQMSGRVDDLNMAIDDRDFAVGALDIELGLNGDRYTLNLDGQAKLDWIFLYNEPVNFDVFNAALEVSQHGLHIQQLDAATSAFELIAAGDLLWPNEDSGFAGPFMDLTIDVPRLQSANLRRWLPLRGIPRKTRAWLDQALVALDSGRALTTLYGWPLGWEQYTPPGAVHSVVDFNGLDLQYGRNWPMAQNMRGRVAFESERMVGMVEAGEAASTPLRAPAVIIPQMREAEIEIQLASDDASAAQLLNLVKALPLEQTRTALEQMDWQGEASAVAEVMLPVKRNDEWTLTGQVDLNGVDFELMQTGFSVAQIQAEVPFDRNGFGPALLSGQIGAALADFSLQTIFEPEFSLSVVSELPIEALLLSDWRERWPGLSQSLEVQTTGRSRWQLDLLRASPSADRLIGDQAAIPQNRPPLLLRLQSDLVGTKLDLPAPVQKPANQAWPFVFEQPLGEISEPFHFRLADVVDGQVLIDPDFWQLALAFGGESARMPSAEQFHIDGHIERLEASAWLDLIGESFADGQRMSDAEMDAAISGWISLDVDEWSLGDAELGSMAMALAREEDFWRLNFDGTSMAGSIRMPATSASLPVVVARFNYLHWPLSQDDQTPSEPTGLDPRGLPELQLVIEDFRWGELDLGQMRLTSHAQDNGLEIEQFSIAREGLELAGSGRWIVNDQTEFPFQTEARMRLTNDSLGTSLNQAGFELALEDGRAVIELDGRWPGSPLDFSLARISGDLDLIIDDGVIPEAQPGAGRVLGLVSFASIPRRLRLDFSDVFGSGLGFDRIEGHFDLDYGLARTDDLRIIAPSADIEIQGETDLRERVYNQTMRVQPGLGSTLPIIGALTGGPIGAAAGVALEQLLNEPISGLSEIQYRVTGSWDDPQVETIGARGAPINENSDETAQENESQAQDQQPERG